MLDAIIMAFCFVAMTISFAGVYVYADDCEPVPAVASALMAVVFGGAVMMKLLHIGGFI